MTPSPLTPTLDRPRGEVLRGPVLVSEAVSRCRVEREGTGRRGAAGPGDQVGATARIVFALVGVRDTPEADADEVIPAAR